MTTHTQAEIFKFLNGEGTLEGVFFGEAHPSGQAFWWRKYLSVAAPSTSAADVLVEECSKKAVSSARMVLEIGKERDALRTEIEALKKELSVADVLLEECKMDWSGDVTQIRAEHKHELAALRDASNTHPDSQDAARYRWLHFNMRCDYRWPHYRHWYYQTTDVASCTLDAVVDAAIKGGE